MIYKSLKALGFTIITAVHRICPLAHYAQGILILLGGAQNRWYPAQLPIFTPGWSGNYGKVPCLRAQHVGGRGTRTTDLWIIIPLLYPLCHMRPEVGLPVYCIRAMVKEGYFNILE